MEHPYGKHLPIFHTPEKPLSEAQLEESAARYMDRADRALMAGKATQGEYERWTRALDAWVKRHWNGAA